MILDTPIWTHEVVEAHAKAYGMSIEQYKKNILLKVKLNSKDIAKAALALVSGYFEKTTGAQTPLDDGSERTL